MQETKFDKAMSSVRMSFFNFMHNMLNNQVASVWLYKALLIIEALQMLYYSFNPKMDFLFDTPFFRYFMEVVQYLQPLPIAEVGGGTILLTIFYVLLGFQFVAFVMWVVCLAYANSKRQPTIVIYMTKVLSVWALLLMTILIIPIVSTIMAVLLCRDESPYNRGTDCYSGFYYIHFGLALLASFIFAILVTYFKYLYGELNPFSALPFAGPQTKANLMKLVIKFLMPLYKVLDYENNAQKQFVAVLVFFYLFQVGLRLRAHPLFFKAISYILLSCEVILLWTTLVSIIHAYLDFGQTDDLGFMYWAIGVPMVSYISIVLYERHNDNVFQLALRQFRREEDIELYIYQLIDLIENRDDLSQRIKLEGLLLYHSRTCMKAMSSCNCRALLENTIREEESVQRSKQFYHLIRNVLRDGLERFQKFPTLHLLSAYIHHEKLGNRFKALFELTMVSENKPTVFEEFSFVRYRKIIEQEMRDFDTRTVGNENKSVDVNQIVQFQNIFVRFVSAVEVCVDLHLEFWRELQEASPDIVKLQQIGTRITVSLEEVQLYFKKLSNINANDIRTLNIYGNFLKDIVNEDLESGRILDKAEYIKKSQEQNRQFVDLDKQKYGENSSTCILTCSGNYNSIGIVINSNKEITRILGFTKNDIIGSNISRIMPKVYADVHDQFIRNFLETSTSKVLGQERLVLAQNKQGYLIPCTLMIKVLPNLDHGIQFVGFLKDVEETKSSNDNFAKGQKTMDNNKNEKKMHFIMYNAHTNVILGISDNCYENFGIPASLVYGNNNNTSEFSLDAIIPEASDPKNAEKLKNFGMIVNINTSTLRQDYLIGQNDSDEDELDGGLIHNYYDTKNQSVIQQNNDSSNVQLVDSSLSSVQNRILRVNNHRSEKYRKAAIKAMIVDEQEFFDTKVHILQFMEADEATSNAMNNVMGVTNTPMNNHSEQKKQQEEGDAEVDAQKGVMEMASERDSQGSAMSSLNEDNRMLKDFKQLMGEKSDTKNIKIVKRTVLVLGVVLITLTSVDFGFKNKMNDDVLAGADAIHQSNLRLNQMGEVLYYTRMLGLTAQGVYNRQPDTFIRQQLLLNVDRLRTTQFNVIKNRISMDKKEDDVESVGNYDVSFLLQDGTIKVIPSMYDDAFFQFQTSATAMTNASLESFKSTDRTESTQKNFFYVITNGYGVIREGSEDNADIFYDAYKEIIQGYDAIFIVLLSLEIFFLVISLAVLIPLVFQIKNINSSVLSLFGMLQLPDIKMLATRCEGFKMEFLQDTVKQVTEDQQKKVDVKAGQQQQQDASQPPSQQKMEVEQEKVYMEINNEEPETKVRQPVGITMGATKNQQPQEGVNVDADQVVVEENTRAQKLLNTKSTEKFSIVSRFFLLASIFIAYFVGSYVLEQNYQSDVSDIYQHLHYITIRPYQIKFTVYLTFEKIVAPDTTNNTLRQQLISQVYDTERDLQQSMSAGLPSAFDNYVQVFDDFNYGDLCEQSFSYMNFTLSKSECSSIQAGFLKKGLSNSIISIALNTNVLLNLPGTKAEIVNSDDWNQEVRILGQVSPSLNYLNYRFLQGIEEFLHGQAVIEQIKFSCFLVALVLIFLFIWTPFNSALSRQIWRIKGMLNMIPIDIIRRQEDLKQAFLQGEIIQAVK